MASMRMSLSSGVFPLMEKRRMFSDFLGCGAEWQWAKFRAASCGRVAEKGERVNSARNSQNRQIVLVLCNGSVLCGRQGRNPGDFIEHEGA
jgi:hypothetical protein